MKKRLIISICLVMLLSTSFVSAGFFGDLWGKITGKQVFKGVPSQKIHCTEGWECKTNNDRAYQYSDCSWSASTYCSNGCENGACKEVEVIEKVPIEKEPIKKVPIEKVPLKPTPIQKIPACSDSDGNNTYVKGIVSFQNMTYTDYCQDNITVIENICQQGYAVSQIYNCPYKCEDGACVVSDVQISIATLKEIYKPGEQIKLTDPPEITGEVEKDYPSVTGLIT